MTYSLVARDPETGALGVAVQSHFFAVGALVTWAEAGVGAIATQSFVDPGYGPLALERLRIGHDAEGALAALVAADPLPEARQVAVVDAAGRVAAHTGDNCVHACGHEVAEGASAQANMMAAPGVPAAMLAAFRASAEPFAERLLGALDAAEAAGGDIRGRQSAALLVVGRERTERPWEGVLMDLRVDDDPEPLHGLRRLVEHRRAYDKLGGALFGDGALLGTYRLRPDELQELLARLDEAQELLGANPEPTFWRAALLARAGHAREAQATFARAAEHRPSLLDMAARLPAAGLIPHPDPRGGA